MKQQMCWMIASAKSELNRRKQREFEQKVAKEAKIWAINMGGRKFAPKWSFQRRSDQVAQRAGAAVYHARKRTYRMITLKILSLIGLCFLQKKAKRI
jgi:hypothetical protein